MTPEQKDLILTALSYCVYKSEGEFALKCRELYDELRKTE